LKKSKSQPFEVYLVADVFFGAMGIYENFRFFVVVGKEIANVLLFDHFGDCIYKTLKHSLQIIAHAYGKEDVTGILDGHENRPRSHGYCERPYSIFDERWVKWICATIHGFLIKTSVCKVAAVGYTERDNQCQLEVADVPQITVTTNECRESRIFYRGPAQPDRSSRQSG